MYKTTDSAELEIFAFSTSTICAPLTPHVNLSEFSHLLGLQLADTFDNDGTETIDILVGADQYLTIFWTGSRIPL